MRNRSFLGPKSTLFPNSTFLKLYLIIGTEKWVVLFLVGCGLLPKFSRKLIPGFTVISKIRKIRELSGNLKNSLIFTKNQGIVGEFGTASGIFHSDRGIFRDESAPFVVKCDTWKRSPNLGWLWFPFSSNFLEKWLYLESWVCQSSCNSWKLELCLKYFLLLE